jgi:hypothetical protein
MEPIDKDELAQMRELANRVKGRPLLYGLVMSDIYRWEDMAPKEQEIALRRTVRRASIVEPQLHFAAL